MTHPIEAASYEILGRRVDLSALAPGPRAVVERVIHASADLDFATSMVVPEPAVAAGVAALRRGASVVVDVEMVRAAITGYPTTCLLEGVRPPAAGREGPLDPAAGGPTRSALGVRAAVTHHADGAVWVVGCAPTALAELLRLAADGRVRPALVVGVPVGFVGAADSKEATRRSGLLAITNIGEKGGSAVAAAVVNALLRLSRS